jgi:hypothetical protein
MGVNSEVTAVEAGLLNKSRLGRDFGINAHLAFSGNPPPAPPVKGKGPKPKGGVV